MNVVLHGHATLGIGRNVLELGPGQFACFAPGQDHVLLHASDDLDLFVLALTPALAERAMGARVPRSCQRAQLSEEALSSWRDRLVELDHTACASATETSLVGLFADAEPRVGSGHVTARRALKEILREPGVSATTLSERLGTGPCELSRRVHGQWGVPFVELRARAKLMKFVALVDRGSALTRAALEADFGSYAQCHRVFRKRLGCSPSEYFAGRRLAVASALKDGDAA
ncbi:helix-turn-helix domain-containing protein [Sorangium sp. So ce590]|uniref:AraC family transcriptional regulator n=1 Tax=unclassified Sorangium TaxID=2621164 RepID=UPI003F647371